MQQHSNKHDLNTVSDMFLTRETMFGFKRIASAFFDLLDLKKKSSMKWNFEEEIEGERAVTLNHSVSL